MILFELDIYIYILFKLERVALRAFRSGGGGLVVLFCFVAFCFLVLQWDLSESVCMVRD